MNIEFLATVAVIAPDPVRSRNLYIDALGLLLLGEGDGYSHSETIPGCKSFGIWPLSQAAQACFGTDRWPAYRPVPQVSIEFECPAPMLCLLQHGNSSRPDTICCMKPGKNHGSDSCPPSVTRGAIIAIAYTPVLPD